MEADLGLSVKSGEILALVDAAEAGRGKAEFLQALSAVEQKKRVVESLGTLAASLANAAVIDGRVLLAHRLGAEERAWPADEDRYASDLLRPDDIRDPWLGSLTRAALEAPVPVLLGAHTLVGPAVPLLARAARLAAGGGHGVE